MFIYFMNIMNRGLSHLLYSNIRQSRRLCCFFPSFIFFMKNKPINRLQSAKKHLIFLFFMNFN